MIKKLPKSKFFIFILLFMTTVVLAQTNTYTGANGNWNIPTNWSLGVFPTSSHDVVIPAGKTVTVTADAFAKSIVIMSTGILTINNNITLTVFGNVTINAGGQFNAGTGNNESATIKIFGNFTNQGTANFWKSSVIIAGDLFTSSTILHNNGDIVVGGNVSAIITGGGNGFVYPVNPGAIVSVTGTSNAQPAGTKPIDPVLIALMNEVIYGGTCPFTINPIASVAACSGGNVVFNSSATGTTPVYKWQVNEGSEWIDLVNGTLYSGVAGPSLSITGVTTGMSSFKYRTKVTVASCTKNGDYGSLKVNPRPATPTITTVGTTTFCAGGSVILTSSAATSYLWSTNETTQSITVSTSGSYTAQVKNATGCESLTSLATVVTVNALPNNITSNGFSAAPICIGDTARLTYDAEDSTFSSPYSITYRNDKTLMQYTVSIPSASPFSFSPADNANPTVNIGYTITSISNATCTRTSGFGNAGANLIVRSLPTATITGTTSVCQGSSSPNITFTNPQSATIIVTYNINGGSSITAEVASGGNTTVAAVTTSAGTFTYNLTKVEYKTLTTCSSIITGSNAVITVNSLSIAPTIILGTTSICNGSSTTLSVSGGSVGTGAVAKWYSGTCGGALVGSGNTITVLPSSTTSYFVRYEGTCNTTSCFSTTVTVNTNTVSAASSTPTVCLNTLMPSITHTTVNATGIGTALNLPAGVTAVWTSNTITISGTPTASGTFNYSIPLTGGCGTINATGTIIVPSAAIWNGIIWTNGPPTSTQAVVFNGNYRSSVNGGDVVACSCQVNSGTVIFDNGNSLKVTNKVTVSGGSLVFDSQSSLVQINNVSNSGNITYNRTLNGPITKFDYTYWSSPVSPQTLYNVSPDTRGDKFYSFDGASYAWVQVPSSTVMAPGIGYIIRGPEPQTGPFPPPPGFFNAPFIGVPNNGPIQVTIAASTYVNPNTGLITPDSAYLLGNPYPSALYADKFIKDNPVLEGTLYFWTHNTTIGTNVSNPGSGVYAYSGDDYASYNLTGGAAAGTGTAATATGYNNTVPSGKIGSGQGFFASTKGAGTVTFDNTMRVGANGAVLSNSEFFKMQLGNKTDLVEKNRIWLNMFNTAGAFKQTLVGYVTGATNDIEGRYDGESFDGYEFLDFYSINQAKNLVIQGRGLPFDENDTIPLGFRSGIEGDFTIAIDQVDGLFKDQNIFIKDKLLNVIHDLKNKSYTFTAAKGVFNDRFVLLYSYKKASAVASTLDALSKLILVSTSEKEIRITSSLSMDAVRLYDLSGKEIFNKTKVNNTELAIRNLRKGNTVYVVKIKLDNGQTVTHKVIY
jgi:hypothetical protein